MKASKILVVNSQDSWRCSREDFPMKNDLFSVHSLKDALIKIVNCLLIPKVINIKTILFYCKKKASKTCFSTLEEAVFISQFLFNVVECLMTEVIIYFRLTQIQRFKCRFSSILIYFLLPPPH